MLAIVFVNLFVIVVGFTCYFQLARYHLHEQEQQQENNNNNGTNGVGDVVEEKFCGIEKAVQVTSKKRPPFKCRILGSLFHHDQLI